MSPNAAGQLSLNFFLNCVSMARRDVSLRLSGAYPPGRSLKQNLLRRERRRLLETRSASPASELRDDLEHLEQLS